MYLLLKPHWRFHKFEYILNNLSLFETGFIRNVFQLDFERIKQIYLTLLAYHGSGLFSHLKWDFDFQKPQHLLAKFSSVYRIFYVEEPLFNSSEEKFSLTPAGEGIWVVKLFLKVTKMIPMITSVKENYSRLYL